MKVMRRIPLQAPPETVARVLCSEAYNVAREQAREEVVSTSYHLLESSAERTVFELRSVEHKRTLTGGIDRSGTASSVTHCIWITAEQTLSWRYEGGGAPTRINVTGVYRLSAEAAQSHLTHEITIEVKVPVIGAGIAKLAAREFEKSAETYEEMLRRMVREAATSG